MTAITHIAGPVVTWHSDQGPIQRQRCSWCGALIDEVHLARFSSSDGKPPASWGLGNLIRIDGNVTYVVEDAPSEAAPDAVKAPDDACTRIDPAVTR